MYRVFIVLLSVSFLFISCNNDDNSSLPIEESNFYALTIGNNWKYEYFQRIGQTDEFESMGVIEEVLITETTGIDGEIFFTFQSTTTGDSTSPIHPEIGVTTNNKRDSLGYLIEENHTILFSNESLVDYLISENIWGDLYGVLKEDTEIIEVEAGSFITNKNEIYALFEPAGEISPGRDNRYFSEEDGEILRKYSGANNPQHKWEKRLVSFEIID